MALLHSTFARALAITLLVLLALAGPAHADPTAPQLDDIPYWTCPGVHTVNWGQSQPDVGAKIVGYEFVSHDFTVGSTQSKFVLAPPVAVNVAADHVYIVRVRAVEYDGLHHTLTRSQWSADAFNGHCFPRIVQPLTYVWPSVEPDPRGPLASLHLDDPAVAANIRSATLIPQPEAARGIQIDARGAA